MGGGFVSWQEAQPTDVLEGLAQRRAAAEAEARRLAGDQAARSLAARACLRRRLSVWRAASQRRRAERAQESLRQAKAQARAASRTGQRSARRRERIVAALREAASDAQAVLAAGVEGSRWFARLHAAAAAHRAIGSLTAATAAYDADYRLAHISDAASPRAEARRRAGDALARLQKALRGALGEVRDAEERALECLPPGRRSDPDDVHELLRHEAARAAREAAEPALRGGDYRYAREDKGVEVQLLLFESFGGFGKGVREILRKAADVLQCTEQALTRAQYLDEVTWTTKF